MIADQGRARTALGHIVLLVLNDLSSSFGRARTAVGFDSQ